MITLSVLALVRWAILDLTHFYRQHYRDFMKHIPFFFLHFYMMSFQNVSLFLFCFYSSIAIGFRGGVFSVTFARLNIRLRNLLFRSLMHQDIGFFDANHTGNIIAPIIAFIKHSSVYLTQNMYTFLRNGKRESRPALYWYYTNIQPKPLRHWYCNFAYWISVCLLSRIYLHNELWLALSSLLITIVLMILVCSQPKFLYSFLFTKKPEPKT